MYKRQVIGHLHKVTVLFAIDDAEGMHVGVLAEIFQLGLPNLPADADNPSAPGNTAFHPPVTDGYRDCLLYTSVRCS